MSQKVCRSSSIRMLLAVAVLLFWSASALAQEEPTAPDPEVTVPDAEAPASDDLIPSDPAEEVTNTDNPPPYMVLLLERSELTQEQMVEMRTDGAGWGEIRIATSLAEQMVVKTADTETPLTFDDALTAILAARAEGIGFGEIAQENDLKIGQLLRNRNQVREPALGDGLEAEEGIQAGEAVQVKEKKRGLFGRLAGFLGFGHAKRPDKAERPVKVAGVDKPEAIERPEKPSKPEKMERPERPEKPEKPEKPSKPEKPEKPEKPGRGM